MTKVEKPVRRVQRRVEPWPPLAVEQLRTRLTIGHATVISVLAYAGLLPGEALALSWTDVGKRALRVTRSISNGLEKRTKTGAAPSVRLLTPVGEDLDAWRTTTTRPGGLVFARPDGSPWTRDDWANWRHRTLAVALLFDTDEETGSHVLGALWRFAARRRRRSWTP